MEYGNESESYLWRCGATPKVWNKNEILFNLKKMDVWVINGIKAIHDLEGDGDIAGFNDNQREMVSLFMDKIRYGIPLSQKQMTIARNIIMNYTGQLTRIANGELPC